MASTYLSLNTHIVFATKERRRWIDGDFQRHLHAYIGGIVRNLGAIPLRIGGAADHVHLLAGLRATHTPADFVKEVKRSSSIWASEQLSGFSWQIGYGAFSVGPRELDEIRAYIDRQEDHHKAVSSADELRALLAEHGVEYDERFFE